MEFIPRPRLPRGPAASFCGRQGILRRLPHRSRQGHASARAIIDEESKPNQIIITEVPFQQDQKRLCKAIGDLVKDERIKGIGAMRDESSTATASRSAWSSTSSVRPTRSWF